MHPNQLDLYLKDPSQLDPSTVSELFDMVKVYPYFQVVRMLIARNMFKEGNQEFAASLTKAAAYAGNRSKLRQMIEGIPTIQDYSDFVIIPTNDKLEIKEIDLAVDHPLLDSIPFQPDETSADNADSTDERIEEEVSELIQKANESELKDEEVPFFIETLTNPVAEDVIIEQEPIRKIEVPFISANPLINSIFLRLSEIPLPDPDDHIEFQERIPVHHEPVIIEKPKSRDEIIEKFIREEPRIGSPKREFFSPEDRSRQSASFPEELVSETLAQIYEKQGLHNMAIKIYGKLMLLYPEKSGFFAAQIKEIENKRK